MTTTTIKCNGTAVATTHGPAGTRLELSHISKWTSGVSVRAGGYVAELASYLCAADDDTLVAPAALVQGF